MPHAVLVELVLCHQSIVVAIFKRIFNGRPWQINSKVEVTEVNSHIVVLDLVALILGASVTAVCLLVQMGDLRVPIFDMLWPYSCSEMAIHEDQSGILEAKTDHNRTLVTSFVAHWGSDRGHCDVKDPCLGLSLRYQEDI